MFMVLEALLDLLWLSTISRRVAFGLLAAFIAVCGIAVAANWMEPGRSSF